MHLIVDSCIIFIQKLNGHIEKIRYKGLMTEKKADDIKHIIISEWIEVLYIILNAGYKFKRTEIPLIIQNFTENL